MSSDAHPEQCLRAVVLRADRREDGREVDQRRAGLEGDGLDLLVRQGVEVAPGWIGHEVERASRVPRQPDEPQQVLLEAGAVSLQARPRSREAHFEFPLPDPDLVLAGPTDRRARVTKEFRLFRDPPALEQVVEAVEQRVPFQEARLRLRRRRVFERNGQRPEVVHSDHDDQDVGREGFEQLGQCAHQARGVGSGNAEVQHLELGGLDALVPEGFELLWIGLAPLDPYAVGIRIPQAEHAHVARDPGDRHLRARGALHEEGGDPEAGLGHQEVDEDERRQDREPLQAHARNVWGGWWSRQLPAELVGKVRGDQIFVEGTQGSHVHGRRGFGIEIVGAESPYSLEPLGVARAEQMRIRARGVPA